MRVAFVWKETQAHLGHQPAHPLPRLLVAPDVGAVLLRF